MQLPPQPEPLRTRIYIDGYNFYYGCLRGTPYKWLDLLPLFERHILPSALVKDENGRIRQSILLESPSIKFFTAKIVESVARAADSVSSQARYHTALRKLYETRVIPGRKATIKPESWYAQPELLKAILELAAPVRGSKAAVFKWMEQVNPYLGDQRPIDMIDSHSGASQVLEYIRNYLAQTPSRPDDMHTSQA